MEEPYLDQYKSEIAEGTLTEDFTLEETAALKEKVPKDTFL